MFDDDGLFDLTDDPFEKTSQAPLRSVRRAL